MTVWFSHWRIDKRQVQCFITGFRILCCLADGETFIFQEPSCILALDDPYQPICRSMNLCPSEPFSRLCCFAPRGHQNSVCRELLQPEGLLISVLVSVACASRWEKQLIHAIVWIGPEEHESEAGCSDYTVLCWHRLAGIRTHLSRSLHWAKEPLPHYFDCFHQKKLRVNGGSNLR